MAKPTCARCRKEIEGTAISRKIIFRDRHPVTRKAFCNSRYMLFCSETCAAYEQMAMEG